MDAVIPDFDSVLRDGRAVHIRAMLTTDEAEFLQAFARLSQHARYMRFMHAVREPNRDRLRQVLASFPDKGIGLVATAPAEDGIDIVGSAVAITTGDGSDAEFAITVADDFGGCGLATTLMNTLIDAARQRGLVELQGFVLAENEPMLRLARKLGFVVEVDPDDARVRLCRLRLGPAPVALQSASSGP
jgi:acetyltransferase